LNQLTCGSLFAGIGGFDLGFERAGIKTIWQVEIDEYCRRVLAKHFPDAERFGDIRECGGLGQFRKDTPNRLRAVDIIAGGFPCQDISLLGTRTGLDGDRSGLWREYRRIIEEVRPRYVVIENVTAILGNGMGDVLRDLSACRYDAEWQVIPASAVGAPHIRERVWIVAYPSQQSEREPANKSNPITARRQTRNESFNGSAVMADSACDGLEKWERQNRQSFGGSRRKSRMDAARSSPNMANAYSEPKIWTSKPRPQCNSWDVEPEVGRVAHGLSHRMVRDELRALGNAVVPQIAEWIGRRIVEVELERETDG
jgi:DNA (cytosine-5)-methyltransferase 1